LTSPTLGFSLTPSEQERVRRLADRFAGGNRSLWLRQALELYEQRALLDALDGLQARGDQSTAVLRLDRELVADLVAESAAAPYSAHADRVADLVGDFLAGSGFDEPVPDPDSGQRFIDGTQAAWDAYRTGG